MPADPADIQPPPEPKVRKKSRKRLEREAEQAQRERHQFLSQLGMGLAHEIRNPLNGITLNLGLLKQDLEALPEETRADFERRLSRIVDEVEYLRAMLDEFLQFARPPQMQHTAVALNTFLADLLDFEAQEFAQRDIEVQREFTEDLYPVMLDRQQFAQVIRNLLSNARDAIDEHGTITVSTRQEAGYVEVAVGDNGGGVPKEDEARIFEAFHTNKENGTGLGLSIARRIVQEHGGRIGLDNRPGVGATFWIRLPEQKILTTGDDV